MIDHVEIKTMHFADCKHFYQTVLRPLHMELKWADDAAAGFGLIGYDKVSFLIEKFDRNTPCHLAFSSTTSAQVDAFHLAGMQAGFRCNGQPGPRIHYSPDYYAAFLLDPDGNNVEAVVHI